jgi:hypothetical protein
MVGIKVPAATSFWLALARFGISSTSASALMR